MRIHIPALPHTQTNKEYVFCAYTAKIQKFCTMMTAEGHEIILYGGEHNEAKVTENVVVCTDEFQERHFSDYNWDTDVFDGFQVGAPWWTEMNSNVISAIRDRQQPGDMLGIIAGWCQKDIADAFPEMLPCEWGIGYSGVFADYRVYESYAWAHHLAAKEPQDDIRFFDAIIPNFFDPTDFQPRTDSHGEYLLFLGRHTARKGLAIVEEIAKHSGFPVFTAGQGSERVPGCEYLGVIKGVEKARLIANARALLAPTTYLEPFGGVVVEAQLSGTPAISTDWGGFCENVDHGVGGFRCRTLAGFLQAVEDVDTLDRRLIRLQAEKYLMANIAPMYTAYFERLQTLRHEGWYAV